MPPPYDARCIRVGCLHFSPVFKVVERSAALAGAHLTRLPNDQLDLIVLPQMAFTAIRLGCYVLVGVPERRSHSKASSSPLIVTPHGELFATSRKHFLYETDESWATEGKAFQTYLLPFPPSSSHRGQNFTIYPSSCMEFIPKGFIAPFNAFELATFARERNVDLVICATNSLDSNQESLDSEVVLDQATDECEWPRVSDALRYFAVRLTPLLGRGVAFAACNRVGRR